MQTLKNFVPLLIFIFASAHVILLAGEVEDPFTTRAFLIRYWNKQISNVFPKPSFLINKASPLTAVQSAAFSKLAENQNSLSRNLQSFCSTANLHCFTGSSRDSVGPGNTIVAVQDFKNYGIGGTTYSRNTIVPNQDFKFYGGTGDFTGHEAGKFFRENMLGKFFRENMLKSGTIIAMPDICDNMPKRSFLPRVIVSKLPFSSSKIGDLMKIFHAEDNSTMARVISESLNLCEQKPSQGESKLCVVSLEDMIDFATSVLGRDVIVRTTDSTNGSGRKVMLGSVKKLNGGKIMKSVTCHQCLFPYLLYYCHAPKVRVYEADLLDPTTTSKINHGVAICHIDTSAWSSTHGAFLLLGSEPGKIEVCHWIFENDMTWVVAS